MTFVSAPLSAKFSFSHKTVPQQGLHSGKLHCPPGRSTIGFRCGTAAQERPFRSHPTVDRALKLPAMGSAGVPQKAPMVGVSKKEGEHING